LNIYPVSESAVFHKTREEYGELSNMRHDFVLRWDGRRVHSSEALYQAMKFPREARVFDPALGKEVSPFEVVISQTNAMTSKMKAKKYRELTRPDWHTIKLDVMNYCIRLKYLQHREWMDQVLDDTMGLPIVEKSRRDQLWGAVNDYRGNLVGENLLGCLWMILREERPNVELPDCGWW
jgi:ribA/ribD-fused uncharacterized protein